MSKRKDKCTVVIEDADAVTVRKGRCVTSVLGDVLAAHMQHPLLVLAITVGDVVSDGIKTLDEETPEETRLMNTFIDAAVAYADAVTARWDAEAEARQEQELAETHAGCCECDDCVEPAVDDRDRLIEEELRAAKSAGDMTKGAGK